MTKQVTRSYLQTASLKDLMMLLRTPELILESVDLSPDEARKLLATRLSGLDIGPDIDELLSDPEIEENDRFNEAIELIEASSLLIA